MKKYKLPVFPVYYYNNIPRPPTSPKMVELELPQLPNYNSPVIRQEKKPERVMIVDLFGDEKI